MSENNIKKWSVFLERGTKNVWVIIKNQDLCNIIAHSVNFKGKWILCLNPECKDNDIDRIRFLSE